MLDFNMCLAICYNFNVKLKRERGARPPRLQTVDLSDQGGGGWLPLPFQLYIEISTYGQTHVEI